MDFAFFAANLGYTKADYEALTWTEIEFVKKAWEDRIVRDTHLTNTAHHVALVNANRKKGMRSIPVLRKRDIRAITLEKIAEYREIVERIKQRDEISKKEWIKKIYRSRKL